MYASLFLMRSVFSQDTEMMSSSVESQQGAAKRARYLRNAAEGGVSSSVSSNKVVPAQFNPGRGAELSWTRQNLHNAIRFKTGEAPGPDPHDAFLAEKMLFAGQKVSIAFAFKGILDASLLAGVDVIPTRFYTHNVFRHTNAAACGVTPLGGPYAPTTLLWNATLGPDSSLIRQAPPVGSCNAPAPLLAAGFSTDIRSAFRSPPSGTIMYSRLTRQNLENFMWNANPMKVAFMQIPGGGPPAPLALVNMQVYRNAVADPTGIDYTSLPWDQQSEFAPAPGTTPQTNRGYYYKCQSKQGHVAYQFNNDGTSPIVIDVVITRIKRGMEVDIDNGCLDTSYTSGYANYMNNQSLQQNYAGQPFLPTDCLDNARVEFLPAKALKFAIPVVGALGGSETLRPFKQVARDQFIVAGGSTRPWSMDFQSLNYNANDYTQTPVTGYDGSIKADDLTYIVSIAVSTLSVPLAEFTASAMSVVDRSPQSVNCSITGIYTENPLPVYLSRLSAQTYVQGALDNTWYSDPEEIIPTLYGIDIANAGNTVRSANQSTAYIQVGPTNTLEGA